MSTHADLASELHASSLALFTALRERDPGFLDHLERRQRALLALQALPVSADDLPLLHAAARAGDAAAREAQLMRQESLLALASLHPQRLFWQALAAGAAGLHGATLDVNA